MSFNSLKNRPIALTIAGSDSGGNAGIQADIKTFMALGVFGSSAITATTAQNPDRVVSVQTASVEHLSDQVLQVLDYYPVAAIKTGMLANAELVRKVASILASRPFKIPLVLDPVMVSTSGAFLLEREAIDSLMQDLIPLATVITPNLDEAAELLEEGIITHDGLLDCAMELAKKCGVSVLLKGGHLSGSRLMDVWCAPSGEHRVWNTERIERVDTHGSGCTLSAAIAAYLAKGIPLVEAIDKAREYLLNGMRNPLLLGEKYFINHFGEET